MVDPNIVHIDPDGEVLIIVPAPITPITNENHRPREYDQVTQSFLVSANSLARTSKYFEKALSGRRKIEYTETGLMRLALRQFYPWVVQAILLIMHGMEDEAPGYVTLTNLFDIAVAADFLDCRDVLEGCVQRWLSCCKRWHFDDGELGFPTWQWVTVCHVFQLKGIYISTVKLILEHALTALEVHDGLGPLIHGFLTHGCYTGIYERSPMLNREDSPTKYGLRVDWLVQLAKLVRDHLHRLQHGPHICGSYCDATYLGLMLILNKDNLLPADRNNGDSEPIYGLLEVTSISI